MANLEQADAIAIYTGFMVETKVRMRVIDRVLTGEIPMWQDFATEFCYLQFRFICEDVALACLAAHGESPGVMTTKIRKEYAADKILSRLQSLNPNFYPAPVTIKWNRKTKVQEIDPLQSGFLAKDDLVRLVGKCGDVLHRGPVTKWARAKLAEEWFKEIPFWRQQIRTLLSIHIFPTMDNKHLYICDLGTWQRKVQIFISTLQKPRSS